MTMKVPRGRPKPRVYSYIRFSTPEQEKGDSLRRQREWRDNYVNANGYHLDTSFKLLDKGRSAFKGEHLRGKGTLGIFLDAVKSGMVPSGSILLVESIDRLTRLEPIEAIEMVCFGLLKHGITVKTTVAEYPPDAVNDGRIHGLIAEIQRAYQESKRKSELIGAARETARQKARDEKKIITAQCPAWLTKEGDKFVVIPEAEEAIRRLFDLKLKGLSTRAIERKLNEEGTWTAPPRENQITTGWRASYITKIVRNRAVIGEYQPFKKVNGKREPKGEAIKGYYPIVVEPPCFFAVQEILSRNQGTGGRADQFSNIFKSMMICKYCGGPMSFDNKGERTKGGLRFVCYNGQRNAGCRHPSPYAIRFDDIADCVLDNCPKLKPEQVLPEPDEQAKRCQALTEHIQGLNAQLTDIERKQKNLLKSIAKEDRDALRKALADEWDSMQQQHADIEHAIAERESELQQAERDTKSFATWQRDLKQLRESIEGRDQTAIEMRMRLNAHLRELIKSIEVFAEGYAKGTEKTDDNTLPKRGRTVKDNGRLRYIPAPIPTEDDFYDAMMAQADDDLWRDKMFRGFIKQIAEQRRTKKGRFVRVHFTTGAVVDLVPEGSLASGVQMTKDARRQAGWRFVNPKLDRMWRDWKTEYNKKAAKKR
ncbi:MAG: recombinase family protein [Candidatus Hydrogenedentes bacterium]|nr:recombinase family protein [Candidatus Hydrogenedentota bacterium]